MQDTSIRILYLCAWPAVFVVHVQKVTAFFILGPVLRAWRLSQTQTYTWKNKSTNNAVRPNNVQSMMLLYRIIKLQKYLTVLKTNTTTKDS